MLVLYIQCWIKAQSRREEIYQVTYAKSDTIEVSLHSTLSPGTYNTHSPGVYNVSIKHHGPLHWFWNLERERKALQCCPYGDLCWAARKVSIPLSLC